MKKIKVSIDKERCIGCGTCNSLMPEVFEINSDMKAEVTSNYKGVVIEDEELIARILETKDMCVNKAIIVEELE